MFLWCVRDGWRDIYSERRLLLPISSSRSQGCQRLHLLASSSETPLVGYVSHARLRFSAFYPNLTAWFSSRDRLPVTHLFERSALTPLILLFNNQNMSAYQSTRGHEERTKNPCHRLYNTYPLIFMSPSPITNPLGIDPNSLITIGITVTFMFHRIFLVVLQDLDFYLSYRFIFIFFSLCGHLGR